MREEHWFLLAEWLRWRQWSLHEPVSWVLLLLNILRDQYDVELQWFGLGRLRVMLLPVLKLPI